MFKAAPTQPFRLSLKPSNLEARILAGSVSTLVRSISHPATDRERIRQADAMGEFALGEVLRKIIQQEQDHLQDLADALGIDTPEV